MRKSSFVALGLTVLLATVITIIAIGFPVKRKKIVDTISQKYGLDTNLVFAVINVESGWDAHAVSQSGAVGLMQVMPSTADEIASKLNLDSYDLNDFEDNLTIGCFYLRYLIDLFDDQKLALCAYNAGLSNVYDWLDNPEYSDNGVLTKIPFKETRNYIKKVNFNKKVYDILF